METAPRCQTPFGSVGPRAYNGDMRRLLLNLVLAATLLAQPPAAQELARQVIENELRQLRQLEEFTFQYERSYTRWDGQQKMVRSVVESGEAYMSHRRNIDIPLVRNGRALKPKDLDKVRKTAAAQMEADAKLRKADESRGTLSTSKPGAGMQVGRVRMSSLDVLRYCQLSEPKQEAEYLEMAFDQCQSPWPEEAHFPHIRGALRIDAQTRVVESWKAWISDGPGAGALFFEQTTQPAPGGIRVIALNRINPAAAPDLFPDLRIELVYRWSKPQRFQVGAEQTIEVPRP